MKKPFRSFLVSLAIIFAAVLVFAWSSGSFTGLFSANAEVAPESKIRIASWNIENFGQKKANDPLVMALIAENIKSYDIIAIQEISNLYEKSDASCPRNRDSCPGHENCGLISLALDFALNEKYGQDYRFVFSDAVRDERYLYVYNPDRVALVYSGLVLDPGDTSYPCDLADSNIGRMARQPFKAVFQKDNFTFTLLSAHTSPSRNIEELEGLEYFYRAEESAGSPSIIVLGDLNADCNYLPQTQQIGFRDSRYTWVVSDSEDTTAAKTSCAYDRFIFTGEAKRHFTGNYGISATTTDAVSDHYLVWAEFTSQEIPRGGGLTGILDGAFQFLFG
ncbi:MAG: endonuclease/exonuclease/phosphatase family protein [Candidatus Aenigmarchaeota archaeon]|nr:endonuclease/exonuclease/phosphatase family protein [Candidatus Aenigmarchaeota archaeon]